MLTHRDVPVAPSGHTGAYDFFVQPPRYAFRVTKYDPSGRDEGGAYVGQEDVLSDHGAIEASYLDAMSAFASDAQVVELSIREPGVTGYVNFGAEATYEGDGLVGLFSNPSVDFYDGAIVSLEIARELVRAMLRDSGAWCRLESDNRLWIHVGSDQYLYISTSGPSEQAIATTRQLGLFVERIPQSPYIIEPEEPAARAADDAFWTEVQILLDEHGPLLLEASHVRNQSIWHRVTTENLERLRRDVAPRSRLYIWPNLSSDVEMTLGRATDETVQVVLEDHAGIITSRSIEPEALLALQDNCSHVRAAAIMSTSEDEDQPLRTAVLPDADGTLRARWTP